MPYSFRSQISTFMASPKRWMQLAAFAIVAWALLHDREPATQEEASIAQDAENSAVNSAENMAAQSEAVEPQTASLGLSSIEVIVSRNDTLDRIFRRLQLNLTDLATLRALPGIAAKLDRLYPGEALTLFHRDGELFGLERQLSPSETLKVTKDDSFGFAADILENPLEVRTRTVHGTIDSSLFEAVMSAGAHDQTAMALGDIFGWDIDFVLDIQPGDTFSVTYQEISQDGVYIKDGPVLAARFINQGREHVAVRFEDSSGVTRYYAPDGKSLRRAFLRAPLEFTRVSSGFNLKRRHPVLNRIRAHKGVDYAAPTGTPVRAAGEGRVIFAGRKGGYGNVVEIAHSNGVVTRYGHLSRFAKNLRKGRHVEQGKVVGYVGMSGLATGPHLHYEYMVNGVYKNPQTVKLPDATPLDPALRQAFLAATRPLLATLDTAPAVGPMLATR